MEIKKIVTLGLAAGLMAFSALSMAGNNVTADNTAGVTVAEAASVISTANNINISHIAPNADVKLIVMTDKMIKLGNVGGYAEVDIMNQTCNIGMPISTNFVTAKLGSAENRNFLGDVTDASNLTEERMMSEFAIIHEASHCNLYSNAKPFISSDKTVEANLNKYFRYSSSFIEGDSVNQSIYYTLHENYADTLAAMEMIRTYGGSNEVLSVLNKIAAQRDDVAVTYSQKGFEAHSTGISLAKVLNPEMVSKIMLAPNATDLQQMALEIANSSTAEVIATYGDVSKIAGIENLYTGASTLTSRMIYSKYAGKSSPTSNIDLNMESNELFQLAKSSMSELEKNFKDDFSKFKTENDVKTWLEKNYNEVFEEAMNQVRHNIDSFAENGQEIIKDIASNIEANNTGVKLTLKEIKDNTKNKLAALNNVENKPTVLANMNNIRNSSMETVSSTPKSQP